jgi:hypothetical protein
MGHHVQHTHKYDDHLRAEFEGWLFIGTIYAFVILAILLSVKYAEFFTFW